MENIITVYTNRIINHKTNIEWTGEESGTITKCLEAITGLGSANIYYDTEISDEVLQHHKNETLDSVFIRAFNFYSSSLNINTPGYWLNSSSSKKCPLNDLAASDYKPKLDINQASIFELESLPGIGNITAAKIITRRIKKGKFTDIETLNDIPGIDKNAFSKFSDKVTASDRQQTPVNVSSFALNFKANPCLNTFLDTLYAHSVDDAEYKANIIETLTNMVIESQSSMKDTSLIRSNKASFLEKKIFEEQRAKQIEQNWTDVNGISPIDDTQYMYFLNNLLEESKSTIEIIMFFMRCEPDAKYPTDLLFDRLLEAKQRGVKIRVILDKDTKKDVYNSRIINKDAYNWFLKNKIDVAYDFADELTHTKMVIVDSEHIVIGSHNWTAGSFYAYDDKSVYVHSKKFAEDAVSYFDRLWHQYTFKSRVDPIYLSELKILPEKVLNTLKEHKVYTTHSFISKSKTPSQRKKFAKLTGISEKQIINHCNVFDILRIKGISEEIAALLENNGIDTVPELARRSPENVLKLINSKKGCSLKIKIDNVNNWILQAKSLNKLISY